MHLNLHSRLASEPWAIDLPAFLSLTQRIDSYISGHTQVRIPEVTARAGIIGPVDYNGQPVIPQLEIVQGIGLIRCTGPLARNVGWLDAYFGCYDYDWLAAFVQQAVETSSVSSILVAYDSPGGSHVGMEETAAVIADAAQQKTLVSFSGGCCCSAAFRLAIEAQQIYCSPSSQMGCLGSKLVVRDTSQMFANAGIRVEVFTAGADGQPLPLKAMMEPGKPISEPEREFFTSTTKQAGAWVNRVKERRPQASGIAFEGGWVFGTQALADGLVDALVPSLEALAVALLRES